jgi:hypothetical protein
MNTEFLVRKLVGDLFNDAVSSLDYIASNYRMISE